MKTFFSILICLFILSSFSAGCTEYDEDSAISELALSASQLAERKDIGGLENLATSDFELVPEGFDRKGTKWALYRYFRRLGKFSVMIPKPEIDVHGDEATAVLRTPVAIGPKNYNPSHLSAYTDDHGEWKQHLGSDVDLYQLEATLIKDREMWFVQSVRLERP